MPPINIVELFSGIGGFTKGLMDAGIKINKHYYSEIDKHAIANYKYNFPNAEYIGSVTDVDGSSIERPNIITFGSPCQDFSLAGKRKGMDGERSSLILHAIRLIRELKPNIFIWENVKGAFYSNGGADFWGIIRAFANIGGYRLEWQLLNTSWFLPQNRERIYLVGCLGKGRGRNIFPLTENSGLFNKQNKSGQRRTQAENSTTITAKTMRADDTFIEVPKVAGTLTGGGHSGGLHSDMTICVAQRGRNPENPSDRTTGVHTEQRLEPNSQGTTNTLTSVAKDNLIMVGILNKTITKRTHETPKEINEYLKERKGKLTIGHITALLLLPKTQVEHYFRMDKSRAVPTPEVWEKLKSILKLDNRYDAQIKDVYEKQSEFESTQRVYSDKGQSPTITNDGQFNIMVKQINPNIQSGGKQPYQQNRIYDTTGISPALMKDKSDLIIGDYRIDEGFRERKDGNSPTLQAMAIEDESGAPILKSQNKIRRLTEIECERLQGFPDNFTEYGNYDGIVKKIPKTQRYKLLGNSVTVNVVKEIGIRLLDTTPNK